MFDERGRLWYTSRIRANDNPAFCKAGSDQPSAKVTPVNSSGRQLAVYDPSTKETAMIDTCFGTHHLVFAQDAKNTLWTSSGGGGGVVGWLNTKMWDQTHDEQKSQGWTALVLDTNGNGKRDAYLDAEQKILTAPSGESLGTSQAVGKVADPARDTRLNAAFYAVTVGSDGMDLGQRTGLPRRNRQARIPEPILPKRRWRSITRFRGTIRKRLYRAFLHAEWISIGIMSRGWRWAAATSRVSTGASAKVPSMVPRLQGSTVPEGWTLYKTPGPAFSNVKDSGSADSHYYDWVDQFDTLGLGKNTPIITGNSSDSLIALVNGKFVILRVPYPLGFFAKKEWTAAWTTRRPVGKAKGSGPPGAPGHPSTAKQAKERQAKSYIFRFVPIRWQTSLSASKGHAASVLFVSNH